MIVFLDREQQREYLQGRGVKLAKNALADMASEGTGPTYTIINGRALSTIEWLDAWLAEKSAKAVRQRRRRASARLTIA